MTNTKIKHYFKVSAVICVIIVLISYITFIMLKYEVEGEKKEKLPFIIEKISIVSTGDGIRDKGKTEFLWSGELIQVNDIYMKISKNSNADGIIDKILIQNIEITEPQKGKISFGKITKSEDTSNNYVIENISEYKITGDKSTSYEQLTIANQGGIVGLRVLNTELGKYNSNDEEINYDGRILNLNNFSYEELKFKLKFDVLIEVKNGIKYKTNICVELPVGNILENGIEINENIEINDLIYKRY